MSIQWFMTNSLQFSIGLLRSGFGRRFLGPGCQGASARWNLRRVSLSPFPLVTSDGASRLSTKVRVKWLCRKPKALNHPQAASLGLSLVCARTVVCHSPGSSTDNVLVIGKLVPLFCGLYIFTVRQVLEVEPAQRQGRNENPKIHTPYRSSPPADLPVLSLPSSPIRLPSQPP